MNVKNLFLATVVSLSTMSASYACDIKISWEPWQPYQFKDSAGKLSGLDIELTEAVVKEAGCKATFVEMPWNRQLSSAEAGDVDVVMGAGKSAEREKFANFSNGYRNEINALFVKKGTGADIKTVADLGKAGTKIGITRGSFYSDEVEAMKAKFDGSADVDELNVKKVLAGRLDGFIMDKYTGVSLVKSQNASDKIEVHPVTISSGDVYLLVSKKTKTAGLVEKLNEGLKKVKASGAHAKIVAKYQ